MGRQIQTGQTFPERMEQHAERTWHDLSFNHKTTLSMGMLVPLATKEVYPGESCRLQTEIMIRFAALYLPIMHQCYLTLDWYYVRNGILWPGTSVGSWEDFIKQDPVNGVTIWPWMQYTRAQAVSTSCILNYMGFNAPPGSGTLILQTVIGALPLSAYAKIYDEYYRNDQIQPPIWTPLVQGDNTTAMNTSLPQMLVKRRNWPRDYYTSATPTPQQGADILIPSFHDDLPGTVGGYTPQKLLDVVTGLQRPGQIGLQSNVGLFSWSSGEPVVLQLSSTIRDFRYAAQMTEYLERSLRAGDRYRDFVKRNFNWDPAPMYVDRPVWIGGFSGNVVISEVLATADTGNFAVGQYAGQALVKEGSPIFTYTVPDYGLIMALMTVYPKASYYSGLDNMWRRITKMDYMWEQFTQIGDQPISNQEVWFSWYNADVAWNKLTFGYLPQYAQWRYSNDIVSGQMRTIWEAFHLGRKFAAATDVVLNSQFITCTPDIGRVFVVDAQAGEHECYVHAYNKIEILRRLPKFGLPQL